MQFYIRLTLWFILSFAGMFIHSKLLHASEPTTSSEEQSASSTSIPGEGTPEGTSRPGGSRPENLCPKDVDIPLTAIFSNNGRDFTTQSNPKFWFYVPYGANDINYLEFTILDQDGLRRIHKTQLSLVDEPGIISVSLSEISEPILEEDKLYRWSFKLYCQANSANEPDQTVSGWIVNIGAIDNLETPENAYLEYREQGVWYDAISAAFDQYLQNPDVIEFSEDWVDLLHFLANKERILSDYSSPPNYVELIDKVFVETEIISIE